MKATASGRTVVPAAATLLGVILFGCGREREMPDDLTMPDSMPFVGAMKVEEERSALLDTMPGGEMARGDSVAEMKLLKTKLENPADRE